MPLYLTKDTGKPEEPARFVRAISRSQAIGYVAKGRFTAENIKNPDDIADIIAQGIAIENAGKEASSPVAEPDGDTGDATAPASEELDQIEEEPVE